MDSITKNDELREDLTRFIQAIETIKNTASSSEELLDLGVKDSFAQNIEDMRKKPLESMFQMLVVAESGVLSFLISSFNTMLKAQEEYIEKAVLSSDENSVIQYSILLKEDSVVIRNRFYDILDSYKELSFSNRVKVVFHFVEKSLFKSVKVVDEVI